MRCGHCGGCMAWDREHVNDPLVLKCIACGRKQGTQRAHEEPVRDTQHPGSIQSMNQVEGQRKAMAELNARRMAS